MRSYNLFISHSWAYSENYDRLINLLEGRRHFKFRDYSVPKDDPIHTNGTDAQLYKAILQKMGPCSVVIILAGVYATYSKWIKQEIKIANEEFYIPKSIIAIEPWGSERTSQIVKDNADRIVGWNTESIVSAIRELV
ncbi:MAG: TIR domain-containing protein [Candidatus Poribacteria bacterium]|nr:TIR domain-containing protein [Candidatus Poribacteria bacterium]